MFKHKRQITITMGNYPEFISLYIAGICVAVFLLQLIFGTDPFILDRSLLWIRPWTLITSIFAHSGIGHFLSNMFGLMLFGLILEGRVGPKRTLWLFLGSAILINIFSPYERSLGASGGIYAILGCLAMLRPKLIVWVSGMPMPMILAGMFWAVQDTIGIFVPSDVGNIAHLIGLFIGVGIGIYWRRWFKDKPNKKGYDPNLEKEIDKWEIEPK